MRILQIINSLATGGAEKLLLETIPLYRKQGIEMDILLLWDNDCMFTKELEKLDCCTIHILKKSSNYKDIYKLSHIIKIRKLLKEYDIVHVHLFPAQYFVIIAKWLTFSKVKLIFTEHSTSNRRMQNSLLGFLDKIFYKSYNKIIAITNIVKSNIQSHLENKNLAIEVIENGVDLNNIYIAEPLNKISDKKIILQVSSFQEPKDHKTIIKALLLLPNNFIIFFVGEGLLKAGIESFVRELNLEERVRFLGRRQDVQQLLKSADFIVLSSKYEGLSLSSIEGMASGKPFIASNVPGLKEVVEGAGLLFECGNEKELAQQIISLSKDINYYNSVAQKCFERAKKYDINIMVAKHIALYKKVYEN